MKIHTQSKETNQYVNGQVNMQQNRSGTATEYPVSTLSRKTKCLVQCYKKLTQRRLETWAIPEEIDDSKTTNSKKSSESQFRLPI